MRKYFYSALLIMVCIGGQSYAQNDSSKVVDGLRPKSAIKLNPVYLLNRFPTFQFTYEQAISPKLNLLLSGGVIMDLDENVVQNELQDDFQKKRGFKSNLDIRHYFEEDKRSVFFLSMGFDYFNILYDRSRTFGFDCPSRLSCSYFQFDRYTVKRQDVRVNLGLGLLANMGSNFFVELNFRIAGGYRFFRTLGRVSGFDEDYNDFVFNLLDESIRSEEGNIPTVRPQIGLLLVYRLK